MKNYYELLSIPSEACSGEINSAYYNVVEQYMSKNIECELLQLSEGYEILSNKKTKAEYNSLVLKSEEVNENFITALDFIDNNDLSAAIKLLEDIVSKECTLLIPKIFLCKAYLTNKNSGKAIKLLEQLNAEEPDISFIAGNLAYAYLQRKFTKKAVETYKKALELNDSSIYLWLGLTEVYKAMEEDCELEGALAKVKSLLSSELEASENNFTAEEMEINELIQIPLYVMNKSEEAFKKHSILNEPMLYHLDKLQENELIDNFMYDVYDDELDYCDEECSSLQPIVKTEPKIGRNDPCPCGSGKKHKKCCG